MLVATKMLLSVLIISWIVISASGQVIVTHPTDRTSFLNDDAVFTCLTDLDYIAHWRLNETDYDDLPSQRQDDVNITSESTTVFGVFSLTILARAEYNGTRVQCVAESDDGQSEVSDTATLTIQDLPASVGDLTYSSSSTSIIISWSAPFSLDVTDVDPVIWYSVLIYNVTDNPTAIPCTDCMDITETHYTFTPDYLNPCHKYIFTVIPLNGAGQGHSSNVTGSTAQEPASDIHLDSDVVIEIDEENYTATINFLGDFKNVCTYTLRVVDSDISYSSYSQFANGTVVFKVRVSDVEPHTEYEVFIELSNPAGSIRTNSITFKTSACQQTTACVNGREISIRGDLPASPPVQGCFIFLGGEFDECFALQRNRDSVYHQTDNTGFNTVCVYDIKKDGLPNQFPAVTVVLDDSQPHETIIQATPVQNSTPPDNIILLIRAELSRNGSNVSIICELTSQASCVLFYQTNEKTLIVNEYYGSTTFPVSETVDEEVTTLFLFGKNGTLQLEPVLTLREGETHVVYESRNITNEDNTNDASITAAVTGTVVVVGLIVIAGAAVLLLVMLKGTIPRSSKKVDHATVSSGSLMFPASSELISGKGSDSMCKIQIKGESTAIVYGSDEVEEVLSHQTADAGH